VYREFWKKEVEPIKLAYPLQIDKSWIQYLQLDKNGRDKTPSHVRAALYSNTFLNTDFEYGDKPRRLPIKAEFKKNEHQSTLFKEESYCSIWNYNDREWELRNISIAEDMIVPQWFIDRIDWERVYERLKGKIDKIMKLIEGL